MNINFSKLAQGAEAVYNLLPVVTMIVAQLEQAFPEGGKGQQKLDAARAALQNWYTIAGHTKEQFDAAWPSLQLLVNALVALKK